MGVAGVLQFQKPLARLLKNNDHTKPHPNYCPAVLIFVELTLCKANYQAGPEETGPNPEKRC